MGLLVYMSTLSSILIKIFTKILQTVIKILEFPIKTIISIFRKIFTIIKHFFINITKKFTDKKGKIENNGE